MLDKRDGPVSQIAGKVYNPNTGGSQTSLGGFSIPVAGYLEGSADLSAPGWEASYDGTNLTFGSLDAVGNLQTGGTLTFFFQTTNRFRATGTVAFMTFDAGGATESLRVPVAPPAAPRLSWRAPVGTNLSLTLPTVAGLDYQIIRQPTLATNAPRTVLTNFTGPGTNLTFTLPAPPPAAYFRVVSTENAP